MQYISIAAFWSLGIIWGSNFIYMKMATEYLTPCQIVLVRVLCGFIPVFIYALYARSIKLIHLRHVGHFLVMAILATLLYYYGFVKGAELLSSGVAGALSGSIPIFSLLLAMLFIKEEKVTRYRVIGLMLGLCAVVIIANPFNADISSSSLLGVGYMTLGSLSLGASFIYAKRFIIPLKINASALTTYQLGLGLAVQALITDYHGISSILGDTHATLGLIVGLGLLGTGLAYLIYYFIIDKLGAISAASVTYIPPVVALVIGSFIAGEHILFSEYIAAGFILVAVTLVNKNRTRTTENN